MCLSLGSAGADQAMLYFSIWVTSFRINLFEVTLSNAEYDVSFVHAISPCSVVRQVITNVSTEAPVVAGSSVAFNVVWNSSNASLTSRGSFLSCVASCALTSSLHVV